MYNVCARACMRACTYMRTCVHACVCALTPQHILILCRLQSPQVCCNLCKRSGTFISRDCYFFMSVKEPRFLCLSLEIPYPHIQTCTKHTYTQIHTHLHIHTNRCHDTLHGAPAYAVHVPPTHRYTHLHTHTHTHRCHDAPPWSSCLCSAVAPPRNATSFSCCTRPAVK